MHTQPTPTTARPTAPHRPSARRGDRLLRTMVQVSLAAGPLSFLLIETAGFRNP